MEHVNTTNATRQQQQQQQQHHQLQQHQLEQQQQHNENQQQFCLRWHNHQTSLLSTLPVLLDQSHLTDVTISAEGRQLRAHRVVLSACSTFFMEIFRALEASNHPVIIIPGASFGAIVALLTFMYSGEVNVYEEQIPMLLNLAETLGIKGLADVQNNNLPKSQAKSSAASTGATNSFLDSPNDKQSEFERPNTPSPTPMPSLPQLNNPALNTPLLANKLGSMTGCGGSLSSPAGGCTPLENFFLKSLQFYPNLLPQPLNFSQTALNKTTELLAKYQQQCQLYQSGGLEDDDCYGNAKRLKTGTNLLAGSSTLMGQQQQQKDIKRIDKIVESLRTTTNNSNNNIASNSNNNTSNNKSPMECSAGNPIVATSPITLTPQTMSHFSPQLPVVKPSPNYHSPLTPGQMYSSNSNKPSIYSAAVTPTSAQQAAQVHHSHQHGGNNSSSSTNSTAPYISPEDHAKLQQHIEQYQREAAAAAAAAASSSMALVSAKSEPNLLSLTAEKQLPATPIKPPSNSKLYATCFICHKQLSNQYNLRVHLETHQNVRYACNVCSHVSRSKDALRKHVSYRHPGAPSPCESEARRKRVTKLTVNTTQSNPVASHTAISGDGLLGGGVGIVGGSTQSQSASNCNDAGLTNPYLFLPNQFQLAAAAAAAAVAETNASTTPALDLAHETTQMIKIEPTTTIATTTAAATTIPSNGEASTLNSATNVSSAAAATETT
ncbi:protein abrupt [Drosophila tropicalis]|uniref:protein abrupt n=1 Tax=Drosophila tropicalis TaxID=46794 RepID=UPI0035ABC6EC